MRPPIVSLVFLVSLSLLSPRAAHAWIEKRIQSDSVTVDIARDGTATVTHDILIGVRGAALRDFSFEPVDADAALLPEATATLAKSGQAAGLPMPLTAAKDGARVTFHVEYEKGIRGGSYQVHFSYRTNLFAQGRVVRERQEAAVEWRGFGFPDGIDSARVVFRVPRASAPPRLRSGRGDADGADISADAEGVFLSTLRRSPDTDELEVVRPHVAKAEVVSWRIVADAAAFDLPGAAATPRAEGAPIEGRAAPPAGGKLPPRLPAGLVLGGLLVAAAYAGLLALKTRWLARSCAAFRATPHPLLPLSSSARAVVAGLGILVAEAVFIAGAPPVFGAVGILATLLAATELAPRIAVPLRGPGAWTTVDPERAFAEPERRPRGPGRYLDAGSPLGFVLFASGLGLFVAGAIVLFRTSPYLGVALGFASSVLFPLFCTGRAAERDSDPMEAASDLLEWLRDALGNERNLTLEVVGRFPAGRDAFDELRLRVLPASPTSGAVAIEAGVDARAGALGTVALPFVIVRVIEGSRAADALPPGLFWSRGRTPDERVTVLRPRVPTRRSTLLLLSDAARRLSQKSPDAGRPQPASSAARSAGKADSTAKPLPPPSPAHAT